MGFTTLYVAQADPAPRVFLPGLRGDGMTDCTGMPGFSYYTTLWFSFQ